MTNYAAYFAIEKKLKQNGFNLERSELIEQFTNNAKHSLKELTPFEYKEFLRWLNSTLNNTPSSQAREDGAARYESPEEARKQRQRKKIIALLVKIGFLKDDKADMERIYAWVLKYGYKHKPLNQYTEQELPELVHQAEQFYKSHIERL
ncbi:MAG: hypothetical protein M9916_01995 [Crocinitomicaceae bacterium]|nr:hypothetical protein [Crocinitomicaceae bacterium]